MAYRDAYLTAAGKIDQIKITDVNDVNCKLVSRTVTNLTDDTVEAEDEQETLITTRGEAVCLLANTDALETKHYEWTSGANDYVELGAGEQVPATDDLAKPRCKCFVNGQKYKLDDALGSFFSFRFDRTTDPVRVIFPTGTVANRSAFIELYISAK